jgi:hypothetical protein
MKYFAIALVLLAFAAPTSACPPVFAVGGSPVVAFGQGGCGNVFAAQSSPVVFFQAAPVAAFTPVFFQQAVVVQRQVFVPAVVQVNIINNQRFRTPLRNLLFR